MVVLRFGLSTGKREMVPWVRPTTCAMPLAGVRVGEKCCSLSRQQWHRSELDRSKLSAILMTNDVDNFEIQPEGWERLD